MVDVHCSLSHENRLMMERDFEDLAYGPAPAASACWGGEFVCGDSGSIGRLLGHARDAFGRMESRGIWSERGDEFLYFCSGALEPALIRPANAYVARMWTGRHWDVRRHEGLSVLHLPAEKSNAFPRALARLRRGELVSSDVFRRWCGLLPSKRPFDPAWAARRVCQKIGEKL